MLKGLFVLEIVKFLLSSFSSFLEEEGEMIQLNWAFEPEGEEE